MRAIRARLRPSSAAPAAAAATDDGGRGWDDPRGAGCGRAEGGGWLMRVSPALRPRCSRESWLSVFGSTVDRVGRRGLRRRLRRRGARVLGCDGCRAATGAKARPASSRSLVVGFPASRAAGREPVHVAVGTGVHVVRGRVAGRVTGRVPGCVARLSGLRRASRRLARGGAVAGWPVEGRVPGRVAGWPGIGRLTGCDTGRATGRTPGRAIPGGCRR